MILWEISSGRPPLDSFSRDQIVLHIVRGGREMPVKGTPSQYVELYKKCWDENPENRPDAKFVMETLGQINLIQNSEHEGLTTAVAKLDLNLELMTKFEISTIYYSIICIIKFNAEEIYIIYKDAECNQQVCEFLAKRVKGTEKFISTVIKDIEENEQKFRNKSYFLAFNHYEHTLKKIEEFTAKVSKYKGFIKFLNAKKAKENFINLTEEYDKCMKELHFDTIASDYDKYEEAQKVEKSLDEVEKTLKNVDNGVNNDNQKLDALVQIVDLKQLQINVQPSNVPAQRIDQKELSNPHVKIDNDNRDNANIIKNIYGTIEVACKFTRDYENFESELAILEELSQSPYILRFYGLTNFGIRDFMVFDWVEYGTLRDVYIKYDIPWTRKIKIIRNICRGLVYLRGVNIFHHDLRCKNVFLREDLEPKLGNFKRLRVADEDTRDTIGILKDVVHWMAPELLEKYKQNKREENIYTLQCEMFSFGMLIWELCYEKIPYEKWDDKTIADHVLSGKREKLLRGKFKKEDKEIQEEFIKIIEKTYQNTLNEPLLEKNEPLDFEDEENEIVSYLNSPEEQLLALTNYEETYQLDNKNIILNNELIPIIKLLEIYSDINTNFLIKVLKTVNLLIENNLGTLENFCLLGGIPIVINFASNFYNYETRVESATVIQQICMSSRLPFERFIDCGGLESLVEPLQEDYDTHKELILIMVNGISKVLDV
ncbi:kinase-like protein [Gigaspora margarita]|uniref:Kinase-like protein n=1 Tax=Gigaspora margarita TaxID=4874 RepID=A0A8H3XHK4_GIGMA|nr:kinase-like protein [Gigaspora margarita]